MGAAWNSNSVTLSNIETKNNSHVFTKAEARDQ